MTFRMFISAVITSATLAASAATAVAAEAEQPTARPASTVVGARAAQDVWKSLEAVRLRALQRFDLSDSGRLLADQTAILESRLAEAIAGGSEQERIELAALLQSARTELDAARERAVQRDPEVKAMEARMGTRPAATTRMAE